MQCAGACAERLVAQKQPLPNVYVKPEPFATGLAATHDRDIRRQAEARLRCRDLSLEPLDIPRRNLAPASSLGRSRCKP